MSSRKNAVLEEPSAAGTSTESLMSPAGVGVSVGLGTDFDPLLT